MPSGRARQSPLAPREADRRFCAPGAREYLGPVQGRHQPEEGQVIAEYVVIVAAIAVGCLLAVLVLGSTIRGLFEGSDPGSSIPAAPFTPPAAAPGPASPTSLAECEHGGWRNFPRFHSERECEDYVRGLSP